MKDPRFERVEEIFAHAVEIASKPARDIFLRKACENDDALREEVEGLLEAHDDPTIEYPGPPPEGEQAGQMIGRYKLLEIIGVGGFGVVWRARQRGEMRREVALKVIKPGMDSKEVVARFEAERRALALMDHPNIARIYDAGTTVLGRPYFVMELVKGIPLIEYCQAKDLGLRERLELFVAACSAVQHAHHKGIIHRDLKPSNIMVSPHDGEPVVKVIDFGIAKALNMELTDKTLYTEFRKMIGTPQYMSPEQAEFNAIDIDARSDIYSLGVVLFELLTGRTPLEKEELRSMNYSQIQQAICEKPVPRPSTLVTGQIVGGRTSAGGRSRKDRRMSPMSVSRELDWIVLAALEKERDRRYPTANALGKDVQRYLAGEPVSVGPPAFTYRFGKLVRRHRAAFAAAAAVLLALISGLVVALWGWRNSEQAEKRMAAALVREQRNLKEAQILAKQHRREAFFADYIREYEIGPIPRVGLPPVETYPGADDALSIVIGDQNSQRALKLYDEVRWVLQPLRDLLEAELGCQVDITYRTFNGYHDLIDAIAEGRVDFMRSGGCGYTLAYRKNLGLKILARESDENPGGRVVARRSLGIDPALTMTKRANELARIIRGQHANDRSLSVAFGGTSSGSGRFRPHYFFRRMGIDCGMVHWHYTGGHDDVLEALLNGTAHIGTLKTSRFNTLMETRPDEFLEIHEFKKDGKPWVVSEPFSKQTFRGKNVAEALRKSLLRLPEYYPHFWDKHPDVHNWEKYRAEPPDEYDFPMKSADHIYYDTLRKKMEEGRGFFGPVARNDALIQAVQDEAVREATSAPLPADRVAGILEDEFELLDQIDFDLLVLFYEKKMSFNQMSRLLSEDEGELERREKAVRQRLGQAVAKAANEA